MTDRMQTLMEAAYARWQAARGMSQQDFWDQLSADERFAVFLGNLNYQVCNGGFSQWWYNGYATPETFGYIQRACARIGTDAARAAGALVKTAEEAFSDYPFTGNGPNEDEWDELTDKLDELDTAFYAVNEQFLADADTYLERRISGDMTLPTPACAL